MSAAKSRVLLLGHSISEREFLGSVLLQAGHEVVAAALDDTIDPSSPNASIDALVEQADLVIVDLDVALRHGWVGEPDAASNGACRPKRIVVTSSFTQLLAPFRARVRTLSLPASVQAVEAVLAADAEDDEPISALAEEIDIDWDARDALIHECGVDPLAPDPAITNIAALAAASAHTSMALVTFLDSKKQHLLAQIGTGPDVLQGMPRGWSFCQHVVRAGTKLVVHDARLHPALASSPGVKLGLVRAYAGVPIRVEGVGVVGTVCVLSSEPHVFSPNDLAGLELAAQAVEGRLAMAREASHVRSKSSQSGARPSSGSFKSARDDGEASDSLVGEMLNGKYAVNGALGAGGMSHVYLARDVVLGNLVAIKVMTHEEEGKTRVLMKEAQALASVRHPNIVQVYGWGRPSGGRFYLVLEYVRGTSLSERLQDVIAQKRTLEPAAVIAVLRNLSGALDTLHALGIVHGDVKPANVILDREIDRAVLIDFGLAMRMTPAGREPETVREPGGTPGHSAPEQFDRDVAIVPSPALDVYALATVAHALLTGRGPFANRSSVQERLAAQRAGEACSLEKLRPDLPSAVSDVMARALSPNPFRRYGSPTELVDALVDALRGVPPTRSVSLVSAPQTRGLSFQRIRALVLEDQSDARVLERLSPNDRAIVDGITDVDAMYPAAGLIALLRAYSAGDLARIDAIGRALARKNLPLVLPSLQLTRTPHTLLRASQAMFHRFHDWGRFSFRRTTATRSLVSAEVPDSFAPEACALIGGMLHAAVSIASHRVSVMHTHCVSRGDASCEFDVAWV